MNVLLHLGTILNSKLNCFYCVGVCVQSYLSENVFGFQVEDGKRYNTEFWFHFPCRPFPFGLEKLVNVVVLSVPGKRRYLLCVCW